MEKISLVSLFKVIGTWKESPKSDTTHDDFEAKSNDASQPGNGTVVVGGGIQFGSKGEKGFCVGELSAECAGMSAAGFPHWEVSQRHEAAQ